MSPRVREDDDRLSLNPSVRAVTPGGHVARPADADMVSGSETELSCNNYCSEVLL